MFRLKERKVKILFIIMRKATFQKVAFFIFNCKVRDIRRAVPSLFTLRRASSDQRETACLPPVLFTVMLLLELDF